jgi:hypothetical protein
MPLAQRMPERVPPTRWRASGYRSFRRAPHGFSPVASSRGSRSRGPGATRQIEEMIANLASEGMTILMATHDLAQARRLSQRVLFFHCGKIVEDAPAGRFWNQPETKEGRAFIAGDLLW